MSRIRKLLVVATVLAAGIAFAWPFRKTATTIAALPLDRAPARVRPSATTRSSSVPPMRHVAAKMTSTLNSRSPQLNATLEGPVTPPIPPILSQSDLNHESRSSTRPAYPTIDQQSDASRESRWPREVIHVVQNGDTLEKLAKRYLGDSTRALEIFKINRDRLTNPHLLPIDAELRVPVAPGLALD